MSWGKGDVSSQPSLPFTKEECIQLGQTFSVGWTIERIDQPGINGNPIEITAQNWVSILNDNGQLYCELGVSIPSGAINNIGFGRWQVTHRIADWSVTCEQEEITECPTVNQDVDLLISHTTVNVDNCEQGRLMQGDLMDGANIDYP